MNNPTRDSGPTTTVVVLQLLLRHGRIDMFPVFGVLSIVFADEPVRCALSFTLAAGSLLAAHGDRPCRAAL